MKSPLFEIKLDDSPVLFFKLGDGFAAFRKRNSCVPDSDVGRALLDEVKLRAYAAAREARKHALPSFLEPKTEPKARFPSEPRLPSSGRPTEFQMETIVTLCQCGKPAVPGSDRCYSCE